MHLLRFRGLRAIDDPSPVLCRENCRECPIVGTWGRWGSKQGNWLSIQLITTFAQSSANPRNSIARDPKSGASANSATLAFPLGSSTSMLRCALNGAQDATRLHHK